MKTLATLALCVLTIWVKSQSNTRGLGTEQNVLCLIQGSKYVRYYNIKDRGTLVHIKDKKCLDKNLFILLNSPTDSSGLKLNTGGEFSRKHLRGLYVSSHGWEFIILKASKRKDAPWEYKFNFLTKSWVTLRSVPLGWSTGDREDP